LTLVRNDINNLKDKPTIREFCNCFERFCDAVAFHAGYIEEVHQIFEDRDISKEIRDWFNNQVVESFNNFISKLEEDSAKQSKRFERELEELHIELKCHIEPIEKRL